MASNIEPKYDSEFITEMFAELSTEPVLQTTKDGIAMGCTDVASNNKQPENPLKAKKTNIPEMTMNLLGVSSISDGSLPTNTEDIVYSLISADDGVPQVWIETKEVDQTMRLTVIVSMIAPFAEQAETLTCAGDFIMEVTPTTTIRDIKHGITSTLDICYEDMALVFVGKFLSDSRTIEYYLINDEQTLHLLVESPDQLFKDVFEAFKRLGLSEEKAWFATRSFIHVMRNKYSANGFGNDATPAITEELLLHELQQLYVPDSDESDDSSAEEDGPEIMNSNVVILGGMELKFVEDEDEESDEEDDDDDLDSFDDLDSEDSDDDDDDSEFDKKVYKILKQVMNY